jgi:hypothetical protein
MAFHSRALGALSYREHWTFVQVSARIEAPKLCRGYAMPSHSKELNTLDPYGKRLKSLLDIVEAERGNLAQADSLLGCLQLAMEYGDDAMERAPYYPDVAKIAREIIRNSINALDSIHLPAAAPEKVKEEFSPVDPVLVPAQPDEAAVSASSKVVAFPIERGMRVHRRDYARSLRASDSRTASA